MTAKKQVDLPGKFGRYRILKLLGKGGMGAVYLARDEDLNREVALKVPRIDLDETPQALERFYQEARSAAAFRHPNICPVYEVAEINGTHYLTMAYIEGLSLAELIRLGQPMTQRKIAELVRKLALALDEAHRNGVIHRDIKSSNIMINSRNEPIIMDFGLARRDRPGDARITQSGTIMGSPAYMAPEQVRDLVSTGPACDIYSLGVVLYELLARRLPFLGAPMEVISQLLLDAPKRPSQFRPDVEPALEVICLKALSKKPEDRHPSMGKLAAELLAYLKGEVPATKSLPAESQPTTETFPRKPQEQALQLEDMGGARSMVMAYHEGMAEKRSRPRVPGKSATSPSDQSDSKRSEPAPVAQGFPWLWVGVGSTVGLALSVVGLLLWTSGKSRSTTQTTSHTTAKKQVSSEPSASIEKTTRENANDSKASEPPPPPPPPSDFRSLFNGSDLAGWAEQPRSGIWKTGNNELSFSVGNQTKDHLWLITDRDYGDFILRLEFKVNGPASSLVGLRLGSKPGNKYLSVPIRNDRIPRFAKLADTRKTGALNGLAVNRPGPLKPVASWNSLEIEVRGAWLRVKLNGAETCILPLGSERVVNYLGAPPLPAGRIGLRASSGAVSFRNIEVKEQFSDAPLPGPTSGKPSGQWAIDLKAKANQKLIESMGAAGNDLSALRVGNHVSPIQGVPFQIGTGLIRVGSSIDNSKPMRVEGIKVGASFRTLHLLQASVGKPPFPPHGTLIGSYLVRYADGAQTTIPILYGIDVLNLSYGPKASDPTEGKVAWKGQTRKKGGIRIYQCKWSNPKPGVKVETIDFVSAESVMSSFVLAMTRES
jgi:serine/threonine protein kinase